MRVQTTPDIEKELSDYLTFDVPGAKHMPIYRSGHWDGKARLYHMRYHSVNVGLLSRIQRWASERRYECIVDSKLMNFGRVQPYIVVCDLPPTINPREYQLDALRHARSVKRCILVFPTGSGKSLIMFLLIRELNDKTVLIVVPTVALVKQMEKLLIGYGYNTKSIYTISAGKSKDFGSAKVVISTWQSIYKLESKWFNQFGMVIGDECHTFKAKSLSELMDKCTAVEYRFGLTGTLDGAPVHEWLLEGLFGPVYKTTDTSTLIEEGTLTPIHVNQIILKHPKRSLPEKSTYRDELNFLAASIPRNNYIRRLALSLRGNTLVLFTLVESHGKPLFEDILYSSNKDRKVVFIHGETSSESREEIREIAKVESNLIIAASYGVFSTGIDIPEIHNIILASPSKSRIRVLQSIGRGVRKSLDKTICMVYDISDAVPTIGRRFNFTLNHAKIRAEYYNSEKFPISQYYVEL